MNGCSLNETKQNWPKTSNLTVKQNGLDTHMVVLPATGAWCRWLDGSHMVLAEDNT